MEFTEFLQDMLGISRDFYVDKIEKIERPEKVIRIYLKYEPTDYLVVRFITPEREWQHLSWFEYRCYIICRLPRYIDNEGKVKVIKTGFSDKGRGYTHKFSAAIITALQKIRVQKTVAELYQTSAYTVRSIMEDAVEKALNKRGVIADFEHISIDGKSYATGHEYATLLIDSDKEYLIDMHEGREEKSLKTLFHLVSDKEKQPQLKCVNIDMWKPYMNVIQQVAPQALIVHDKFHLVKKFSEAIDKPRRKESEWMDEGALIFGTMFQTL